MKLFTLIHISKDEKSLINSTAQSFDAQISLYYNCALQLFHSLQFRGFSLVILTNDKEYLSRFKEGEGPEIIQLNFTLEVPKGILFFSAHYKIEIFEYLSKLQDPYVGLIDSDVLCINDAPQCLKNAIAEKIPVYYDITDQVSPAYGQQTIIKDKESLGITNSLGLWAGGEFIAGPPGFFQSLADQVKKVVPYYFNNFKEFHHQGDEVLTSVAIEYLMREENMFVMDGGAFSIIGRFWNARTKHTQKSLDGFRQHFLIHLPADKSFFTKISIQNNKQWNFFDAYKKHLLVTKITRPMNAFKRKLKK